MTSTRSVGPMMALLAVALWGCGGSADTASADAVRALTGAHTRVVWVQADGSDPRAMGNQLVLMGFDTDDGRGERVILGERNSYVKPLLTPSGRRIVFSRRLAAGPRVYIVNWDGSGQRLLCDGFALAVWKNPADGTEWLFVGTENRDYHFGRVERFPIDAPDRKEIVWNTPLVFADTFQVTADGRHAGGLYPWPAAGIAALPNGPVTKLGEGCWTAVASVRGPLFWYFDGAHRNLTLVDVDAGTRWMVNINGAPGFDGAEVYHPRWTNHPRVLAISGPYNQGGENQARTGGKQTEIYLGRFSEDYARVEAWARVSTNDGGDSYPDVWIDAGSPFPRRPAGRIGPAHAAAPAAAGSAFPADVGRLTLNVRLTRPGPVPDPESILPYRHALVVSEYEILDVIHGSTSARRILIAQWAIRDSRVLAEARRSVGTAYTLTTDRYDAHPELEGERLIRGNDPPDLPLYYDVTAR